MADMATLGGIGQGLLSFADSYTKNKQIANSNALNQQYADMASQKEQAGLLGSGMQTDATGTVSYTPVAQAHIASQQAVQSQQDQLSQNEADPDSDESKMAYNEYKTRSEAAHPGSGQFIPQGKSAQWYKTEIEPHLSQEETLANNKAVAQIKANATMGAAQTRADVSSNNQTNKTTQQESKAFVDMNNRMETFRGNKAVGNAADALRSVGNAQELIKEYPDLNQMPQAQVGQLGEELSKIAGGGTASEGGRKEVNSSTYESNLQNWLAKVGNKPTGAQLGEFIKNNQTYLSGLQKANQDIVNNYRKNVYATYEDQLSDDHKQRFKTQMHPELFPDQQGQSQGQGQGLLGGGSQTSPGGQQNSAPTQDPKINSYAQAHGLDYNTAKGILVSRGYNGQ